MKRKVIVLMLLQMLVAVLALGATDEEIRIVIRNSTGYRDAPWAADRDIRTALSLSLGDTNRFTRLMCEVAREKGDGRGAAGMIQKIGRYGNASALPFLYSCVTNAALGDVAVISIFKIEGASSNLIDRLSQYLAVSSIDSFQGDLCCRQIVSHFEQANVTGGYKNYLIETLIGYLNKTNNTCVCSMDELILDFDQTYRHSRRRLSSLRSTLNRNLNDYQINYVTNAINELIAYPEANLND